MRNMNLRALCVLCLLCTAWSVALAQTKIDKLSIKYGPSLPQDKQVLVKIIGEANGKIYGLAMEKKNYFLQTFESSSMKQLSSNQIELPEMNDKELTFEEVYLLNGKLYAIGSVYDNRDKTYNLVARGMNDKGVLDKKPLILFETEVAKKSEKGGFFFKESVDGDMLLVLHAGKWPKEDAVKYEVKLFDDKLGVMHAYSELVKFDDHKKDFEFTIMDFDLNDNGDVFLCANESYRDPKAKSHVEKFEIHAFKKANKYKKEVVKLDVKGKEIINCSMLATGNNTLKLVGFYSGLRSSGKALKELRGIFNATVNLNDNSISKSKFNEFSVQTIAEILGERRAAKGKELKPLYYITNIVERGDGGLVVMSEYQMVVVGKSQGIGPLAMTPVTYTKNEVIITSLNPDGSHAWSNVLPKEQSSTVTTLSFSVTAVAGSSGGSFTVSTTLSIPLAHLGDGPEYLGAIPIASNDGHIYMVFNDNEKNKGITKLEEVKAFTNSKKSNLALFDYDAKGKVVRKDQDAEIREGLVLRPGVYWRKSNNELIVFASRSKQEKLGRMIISE